MRRRKMNVRMQYPYNGDFEYIAPPSPANWCIVFNSSNLVSLPISLLIAAITKACITSLRVLFWLFTKAIAASGDVADIIFNSFCVKPSFCISIGLPVL